MKNKDIIKGINGDLVITTLNVLYAKSLPVTLSIKIKRWIKYISENYQDFVEEKNKLVTKYGKANEEGIFYVDGTMETFKEFSDEFVTLLEMDLPEIASNKIDLEGIFKDTPIEKQPEFSAQDQDILDFMF